MRRIGVPCFCVFAPLRLIISSPHHLPFHLMNGVGIGMEGKKDKMLAVLSLRTFIITIIMIAIIIYPEELLTH